MTNLEKWQAYTDRLPSPQNYINWGWHYLIACALQRRVWIGDDTQQIFPNQYCIFVGLPGIGKSLVIKEVAYFLNYWKLKDRIKPEDKSLSQDQLATAHSVQEADLQNAQKDEMQAKNNKADFFEPLLIPIAADATTYEALVEAVAESYMRINYVEFDEKEQKNKLKIYGHASLCFCLDELASLLRKRTDDTVNYLLGLYNCPVDYTYKTKTQGKDRVRRGCLNILGGTTPSFMRSIFNDNLIGEGFASRTFFIYAAKNRKHICTIRALSPDEIIYRAHLLEHVRKLTTLFGAIKKTPDVEAFIQKWWHEFNENEIDKKPTKLRDYYARKNLHMQKIAMAMHFSDSLDMHIPLARFQDAMDFLADEEKRMHLALTLESATPVAKIANKITDMLATGEKNYVEIVCETIGIGDKKQLEEALDFLQETDQIDVSSSTSEKTGKTTMIYSLKKKVNGEL
jgi:hypothetical protein